jgi:ribosomal protein S27E
MGELHPVLTIPGVGRVTVPHSITVKFECDKCGSSNLVVPDHADRSDWITCHSCGERLATVKQLRDHITQQVTNMIGVGLRQRLEGIKGLGPE